MNVLIVSGIWPPDVGGPATHAPELASWLVARGHRVAVVTTADTTPPPAGYRIHWVSRRLPPGVRHAAVAATIARAAHRADVIYATSMTGRTAVGAAVARRPFVAKLTSDPALAKFAGRYINDSPWIGTAMVVERGGKLWIGTETPMTRVATTFWRVGEESWSPERASFANWD